MVINRSSLHQEAIGIQGSDYRITSEAALDAGLVALRTCDPALVDIMIQMGGRPPLRARRPGFEGLASIIVAQQVSTASAAAMSGRLSNTFPTLTPERLLGADTVVLRACGLSASKIRTLRALAHAIVSDGLALEHFGSWSAEDARRALVAINGIGPWTADIYLLFCLGHPDAWPAGDLALQEAARLVLRVEKRPNAAELTAIAARWRPYRGVAAYLLWACYRAARGRSGLTLT